MVKKWYLGADNELPRTIAKEKGFRYTCTRCGQLFETLQDIIDHVHNDKECGAMSKSFPENRIETI